MDQQKSAAIKVEPSFQSNPPPDTKGSNQPAGREDYRVGCGIQRTWDCGVRLLGITAQDWTLCSGRNKRTDLAALEQVIRQYAVREIVVGLPLRMSGAEGTHPARCRCSPRTCGSASVLPVHLWDERLTSAEANRLLRETDLSIREACQSPSTAWAAVLIPARLDGHKTALRLLVT